MADWMVKLQKALQVIAFVVGAILALMGQDKKVQTEVSAASGAYASPAEAAGDIAKAGNMTTAGFASMLTTVVIPFAFQFIGQWIGQKPLKPGWNAGLDVTALQTLKKITRVGRDDDMVHIDALIASGVALETLERIEGKVS